MCVSLHYIALYVYIIVTHKVYPSKHILKFLGFVSIRGENLIFKYLIFKEFNISGCNDSSSLKV